VVVFCKDDQHEAVRICALTAITSGNVAFTWSNEFRQQGGNRGRLDAYIQTSPADFLRRKFAIE